MPAVALLTPKPPREAFQGFYEREFPFVFHSLRRLGVPPVALEDFTHDVFTVAFQRFDTFDATRPLRPWLFGIAYRVVLDSKRKLDSRRTTTSSRLDQQPSARPSPEEQLALQEAQAHVTAILSAMDLGRRAVFIMHEIDGAS